MTRRELVLAGLAPAGGAPHSPVQVQKLFFLIDRNLSAKIGADRFSFSPYNYGPFDQGVYLELDRLEGEGLVVRTSTGSWSNYSLTQTGQCNAKDALSLLPPDAQRYVAEVSGFVRRLSFTELVSAIYRAYPEMKVNSVFQN